MCFDWLLSALLRLHFFFFFYLNLTRWDVIMGVSLVTTNQSRERLTHPTCNCAYVLQATVIDVTLQTV